MAVKYSFDRILTIALIVALVLGGAVTARRHFQRSVNKKPEVAAQDAAKAAAVPANVLPEAAFADIEGVKVTLADFKGKVLLVNLWATWCPPCVVEMPSLDRLQAKLQGADFKVVAIAMDQPPVSTVTNFLHQKDISHLTGYWDKDRQIPMKWRYTGLPVSFLLAKDGHIVQQFDGPQVWDSGPVFDKITVLLK